MPVSRLDFGTAATNDGEEISTAFAKLDANDALLEAAIDALSAATTVLAADIDAIEADYVVAADIASMLEASEIREKLTSARTYYVRTDGNDSNNGLTDSSGGALLTIQAAIDAAHSIDLNGHSVTIQVGAGTYTGSVTVSKPFIGGSVTLIGDSTTPSNVLISTTSAHAITITGGTEITLGGFKVSTTTSGRGLSIGSMARATIGYQMDFGACVNEHMVVASNAYLLIAADYTISGNAAAHMALILGGIAEFYSRTVTLSGSPVMALFIYASTVSALNTAGMTYSGSPGATMTRYYAELNATIQTNGGGASYFPGTAAGATATGGQYA